MAIQYLAPINNSTRLPGPYRTNVMMVTTSVAGSTTPSFDVVAGDSAPKAESFGVPGPEDIVGFYSERIAANVSLLTSDTVTLGLSVYYTSVNPNACIRARLYKVTTAGEVTEFAGVDDTTAQDSTPSVDTYTFTISRNIDFGVDERILLRLWAIPPTGQTFNTGSLIYSFGGTTAPLTLPSGFTFIPNRVLVYFRNEASAIGGTWKDLIATQGSATVDLVVQTAAVSEKQWTVTSGGALAEWVTPRFKRGWAFDATAVPNVNAIALAVGVYESNIAANAGVRVRVYRLRGTGETEIFRADMTTELGTTVSTIVNLNDTGSGSSGQTNVVLTPTSFQADDRLAVRLFIIPVGGTMPANQTATFRIAGAVAQPGISTVTLFESQQFKAESDPPEPPTPPGAPMVGMVGL